MKTHQLGVTSSSDQQCFLGQLSAKASWPTAICRSLSAARWLSQERYDCHPTATPPTKANHQHHAHSALYEVYSPQREGFQLLTGEQEAKLRLDVGEAERRDRRPQFARIDEARG